MPSHVSAWRHLLLVLVLVCLAQPAFNGVFSAKVARAIMRTRDPPKRRRNPKEPGEKVDGRISSSQAARRSFLLRRVADARIKTSDLQNVAQELLGLLTNPRDFSRVVTVLGSRRQPRLLLKFLEDMDRRLGPSVITYSAAMHSVSKTGNWALATGLLRQLEQRAAQCGAEGPNLITYNTAISALAKAKKWQSALEVFEELASKELLPTESSYSAAMSCCRGAQQWEIALHLNEDMLNRGLRGNLLTWTSLIQALERYAPVLAVRAYGRMKRAGFQADRQVQDAVLRACAAAGLWKRAIFIINKIIEAGEQPSATAYSHAVAACGARQSGRSLRLFEEMKSNGLKPTPAAYVGVMEAYAQREDWDAVLATYEELRTTGAGRVPYGASAAAMEALEAQRSVEDSQNRKRGVAAKQLKIFQEMRKRHQFQPDGVCHSLAAKAHADRYEPVQGMKLVEEALRLNFQPSTASCAALLAAEPLSRDGALSAAQRRTLREAALRGGLGGAEAPRLLAELREDFEVTPEIYSAVVTESTDPALVAAAYAELEAPAPQVAVAAMTALTELRQWPRSLEIFQELQSTGALALKGQSLDLLESAGLAALGACAAGDRWEEALEVLEQLRFRGLTSSPQLLEAAVRACAAELSAARRLLTKMAAAGFEPSRKALKMAQLESNIERVQEMERMGYSPDESLLRSAIAEAKDRGKLDLARELQVKLPKTSPAKPQLPPRRRDRPKRPRARGDAQDAQREAEPEAEGGDDLPDTTGWDEDEDEDEIEQSWEQRVTYF